jgi:hypothetical protein
VLLGVVGEKQAAANGLREKPSRRLRLSWPAPLLGMGHELTTEDLDLILLYLEGAAASECPASLYYLIEKVEGLLSRDQVPGSLPASPKRSTAPTNPG